MLLGPRNVKYKKSFARKKIQTNQTYTSQFFWGNYGFAALEHGRIKAKQIEACRKVLRRNLKKDAKIWIHAFPNLPITKKPQEVRMGKGKGLVKYWVYITSPGKVIFEARGIKTNNYRITFNLISYKLPIKGAFLIKV